MWDNTGAAISWTNWADGHPDAAMDCGYTTLYSQWKMYECNKSHHFGMIVCQLPEGMYIN